MYAVLPDSCYLDWNATAPLRPQARQAALPWLEGGFGNASSQHAYGRRAHAAICAAREQVASALGAHPTQVIFTSGGTEANNLFLKGVAACLPAGLVALGAGEHSSVSAVGAQLGGSGWQVTTMDLTPAGLIDATACAAVFEARPALCSVMLAHNESGVLQDIAALAEQARGVGAIFHTDAAQALGRVALDFDALGVHGLSVSAHKIGGMLGAGALVVDKSLDLQPLLAGGGQERGLRSGTENVAAIVAFGAACEAAQADLPMWTQNLLPLRDQLEAGVCALGGTVFGAAAPRLANTSFFSFGDIEAGTLTAQLDQAGCAVGSGSACSSAQPEPSPALLAMGVPPAQARGAIRVSLGHTSSEEDVRRLLAALEKTLARLRAMTAMALQ